MFPLKVRDLLAEVHGVCPGPAISARGCTTFLFTHWEIAHVTGMTLAAVLHVSLLATGADTYGQALKQAEQQGCPMVVLVGADWCPGCRTMKSVVMPEAQRQGVLQGVSFAVVNTDHQPELANQLMQGRSIPQLVIYTPTEKGWTRQQITGATSVSSIDALLKESRKLAVSKKAETSAKTASVK